MSQPSKENHTVSEELKANAINSLLTLPKEEQDKIVEFVKSLIDLENAKNESAHT